MDQEIKNKVFEYIDAIAQKLGVAAEFIFQALYKQMMLEGIVWTSIQLLLLTVATIVCWKVTKKLIEENQNNKKLLYSEQSEFWAIFSMFAYAGVGVVYFICLINLPTSILKMFNPEYYVIKFIMDGLGIN